jgi:poly-beta-1,6-N-acetyl-D-glucosamine synthase
MMLILKIVALVSLLIYAGYLFYAYFGFRKIETFVPDASHKNRTKTNIIICALNEEKTIGRCLTSILEQDFDFSLLEIVFVNDGSKDNTHEIANEILKNSGRNYSIINNAERLGKKDGITMAMEMCSGELIITRDADTYTTNKDWLKTIVSYYEDTQKEFIICPIEIESRNGLLYQLQFLENKALAIITGGFAKYKKAFLCNGANLAFTKTLFRKVNGYKSHEEIHSGDDVLFLEDVKKYDPNVVSYLKQSGAAIITYPVTGFKNLMVQKVRWASKFDKNPNQTNAFLGIIVCLVHFFGLFYLVKPLFVHHIPLFGIIFICLRFFIDFLLLFLASRYFNRPLKLHWLLPVALFYSFYVIITAFLSVVVKPNRK